MDRELDREFGVSIVVALVLALAIEVVMPNATVDMASIQVQNGLPAQPDLSWLVSP